MFVTYYSRKAESWYVCRSSTQKTDFTAIKCPSRQKAERIRDCLNQLQSELQQIVTSASSMTYKNASLDASDFSRELPSKI